MNEPGAVQVLLIEDNELDARSLTRMLATEPTTTQWVTTLAAGIETISSQPFDCVLLDLSLPDSDGLLSVETMVGQAQHCPVIVLTGLDDPKVALQAVERGAQDYLIKNTVTPELLTRAVRYAIARHSAEYGLRLAEERLTVMHSREQIARDLHDTVIQRLFATGMRLQAGTSLGTRTEMSERLSSAVDDIDDAIRELRQAIFGLNAVDDNETLSFALAQLADNYREVLGFTPVMRLAELPRLNDELHTDLVATAREALSNVARHSGASHVTVEVAVRGELIVLRVVDNGTTGSQPTNAPDTDLTGGLGLANMRARAESHGGSLTVETNSPSGTIVEWTALR